MGSIKPRSSREKAYILQSIIQIKGINPFSGAIAGEAFANLMGFFRVFVISFIVVLSFLFISNFHLVLIENMKNISLLYFVLSFTSHTCFYLHLNQKKKNKIGTMAHKKLGEFATPNDDYLRAPITQPAVEAANYEIKPNFLTLVQQNQFGGSASEDAGMHLNTFTENAT